MVRPFGHICTGTYPHLHQDLPTSAPELASLYCSDAMRGGRAHRWRCFHVCIGIRRQLPTRRDSRADREHLQQGWAHPAHICAGTSRILAASAAGLDSAPLSHLHRDWAHPSPLTSKPGLGSPHPPTSVPGLGRELIEASQRRKTAAAATAAAAAAAEGGGGGGRGRRRRRGRDAGPVGAA
jgi:hypothetical protein